jgi:hypothetical protein
MIVRAMRCLGRSTGGCAQHGLGDRWRAHGRRRRDVLGRVRQHDGALGILEERLGKLHPGIRRAGVPGVLGGAAEALLALLVGHQRGVRRGR